MRDSTGNLFTRDDQPQVSCSHAIRVAFEAAVDTTFDYLVPDDIWPVIPGQRVELPFGKANKLTHGYCIEVLDSVPKPGKYKIKLVKKLIDAQPLLDCRLMELAGWISSYYFCPLGQVLAAILPSAVKKAVGTSEQKFIYLAQANTSDNKIGKKQKLLIEILTAHHCRDEESAMDLKELCNHAQCTNLPVKNLMAAGLAKMCSRVITKALPAIPKAFVNEPKNIVLNDEQDSALAAIIAKINTGRFGVTLLHGVTDSGKTEIYIRAIEHVVAAGKSAIVLLPEIALTAQTVNRFSARFKRVAVMHSGLGGAQRNSQWQTIRAGQADVVIGARSAIFAPLPNLGLVVVDEEHEPSYKQDTAPRYHGRDVAVKRCHLEGVHCILGSATPSLESLQNASTRDHYQIVRIKKRILDLPMPEMRVVDMKDLPSGEPMLISPVLHKELDAVLGRGEQAILLLNRRGYSNYVFCPKCKHSLQCRNCDVTLTFHKALTAGRAGKFQTFAGKHVNSGYALCHYCMSQTLVPEKCPLCQTKMIMLGLGSQKLEEELTRKFPDIATARVDSDSIQPREYYDLLKDFADNKIKVLAGTQILAKGLHFPNVTLVGIISADTSLYVPDFRANERTFQLITQVAGRAGRSDKQGKVVIQTLLPGQSAIKYAVNYDFENFIAEELKVRQACTLPPFGRLAYIVAKDTIYDRLTKNFNSFAEHIHAAIASQSLKIKVRGPMPCVISRIERFHRMQIILESVSPQQIQNLLNCLRGLAVFKTQTKIIVDVDPVNLL